MDIAKRISKLHGRITAGRLLWAILAFSLASFSSTSSAAILRVGPGQRLLLPSQAAAVARDGDVVEIDAGEYHGDVAIWTQSQLSIRGRGGMAKMFADGRAAESKAIWVVRGGDIYIEKIEFSGARVPDHNGAGIRFEKGSLQISSCRFIDNENGILTAADPDAQLDIEYSEFGHNGDGSGLSHNLYVGKIGRLRVTGSYFHHARVGHLLKSRATTNVIAYNRLTDEEGGHASYELEFPNGGLAVVIGNIIEQSSTTENAIIISYGAEGLVAEGNRLVFIHNTLIDRKFFAGIPVVVRAKPGEVSVQAINNLLVDSRTLELPVGSVNLGNVKGIRAQLDADFRPLDPLLWKGGNVDPTLAPILESLAVLPLREYRHPLQTVPVPGPARNVGALQISK